MTMPRVRLQSLRQPPHGLVEPPLGRRAFPTTFTTCLLVLLSLGTTPGYGFAQPPAEEAEEEETEESDFHALFYSAHLPIDRQLSQDLEQAERLLEEGRYSEGLPLVDRILGASEDSFDARTARDSTQLAQSLKTAARNLLAKLPPDGYAALELATGVTARRHLDEGLKSANYAAIARVAGRYPYTKAAAQATAIVAQTEQDAGNYSTAARLYEELAASPATDEGARLLLRVKGALCWSEAGQGHALDTALAALKQHSQGDSAPQLRQWVGDDFEKWAESLRDKLSQQQAPADRTGQWPTEGGSPTRNPIVAGGVPHAWSAWQARTVVDVALADRLQDREHTLLQQEESWLLAASPIAVGDLVIVRTPRNVVAYDWATGRRVWETRATTDELDAEMTLTITEQTGKRGKSISLDPVEQRVWADSVYGSLSADGRRAYAITDLMPVTGNGSSWGGPFFWPGEPDDIETAGNTLCAYELESEGKLVWRLSGATAKGDVAGVFFLGAPLAVGNNLHVMAEISNTIYLITLEPTTGEVLWKQPLVNMERSVEVDTLRRLAGATPSYAEGLILCPTGAGTIVAVDALDRSLRWVHRFAVDKSETQPERSGWNQNVGAYQAKLGQRWSRSRCTVHDGYIVASCAESKSLHCLELATGKLLWETPRHDWRFVVAVGAGKVFLGSSTGVEARNLVDGKVAWSHKPLKLTPGGVILGLGLLDKHQLLLPISPGRVAVLDVVSGKIGDTVALRPGEVLGNLAYHRGSLLSQHATGVSRFEQADRVRKRAEQSLADESDNATALRLQGELIWSEGDLTQAIAPLRRAYELAPDDQLVRERLSEALLEALRLDYPAYRQQSDLLAKLLAAGPQRLELIRLHIDGALAMGDLEQAWEHALELTQDDRERSLSISRDQVAVADRWFAARVGQIWQGADAALRARMTRAVEGIEDEPPTGDGPRGDSSPRLGQLVRYFGLIPPGAPLRLELARHFRQQGRLAEAEVTLLRTDPGQESKDTPLWVEHQQLLGQLCGRFAETSRQANRDRDACHAPWSLSDWSDGRVDVTRQRVRSAGSSQNQFQEGTPLRSLLTPIATGQSWRGPWGLVLIDGGSQLVATDPHGQIVARVSVSIPLVDPANNRPHEVRCFRFGHFAVIGAGGRVASLDLRNNTRNGPGPLLWSSEGDSQSEWDYETAAIRAWQRRRGLLFDIDTSSGSAGGSRGGELCAAGPLGVVVRQGTTLRSFDPLDGQLLWQREGMVSSGPTFSDWEYLFLTTPGKADGAIVSMIDGSTVGTWKRPPNKWLASVGRHVATLKKDSKGQHLEITNVRTGEKPLTRLYDRKAAITQVGGDGLAVMEPSGRAELIDVLSANVEFEASLLPEPQLESLHVVRDGEVLFWGVNRLTKAQQSEAGYMAITGAPLVSGRLYSLAAADGTPHWSAPAGINGLGIAPLQTPAAPALLLLSHFRKSPNATATETTRVLALDKRNGRSIVREEGMAALETHGYWVQADRVSHRKVVIDLERTLLSLEFTDAPRPPEPVAQSDIEEGTKPKEGSILGIFGNFGVPVAPPAEDDDD